MTLNHGRDGWANKWFDNYRTVAYRTVRMKTNGTRVGSRAESAPAWHPQSPGSGRHRTPVLSIYAPV